MKQDNNFIAIDFETATSRRDSICEVGICVVKNGEVKVDWGDGHLSSCHPRRQGERLHIDHHYGNKARIGRNHLQRIGLSK